MNVESSNHSIPAVFESPASSHAAAWARVFTGAASLAAGADPDCADNVRLATSEIVAVCVESFPGDQIRIELVANEDFVVMQVSPWPVDPPHNGLIDPWDLITSIADDVTVSGNTVTVRCRFSESAK